MLIEAVRRRIIPGLVFRHLIGVWHYAIRMLTMLQMYSSEVRIVIISFCWGSIKVAVTVDFKSMICLYSQLASVNYLALYTTCPSK